MRKTLLVLRSGYNGHALLYLSSAILTWITSEQIMIHFTSIGDLELTIFAGLIGFGLGTINALAVLSILDILLNGLSGLLGMWFWSGAYVAIITGGLSGSLAGAGCGILMRISIAKYYF